MPLFKKERSPFYWYDFRFGGKRYRGSTKEKTITAARHYEAQLLAQCQLGEPATITGRPPTLRELMPRFLKYVDNHQQRAINTKKCYQNGARLLLESNLADLPITRITTSVVSAIAFPHSPSTGNNALRTLSRTLSLCVEWGLLRAAPRIHLFREYGREMLFTPEFEQRLLAKATQPLRDVFILMMNTGVRPQEAFRLTWDDILWDRKVIFISKGKTRAATRYVGLTLDAEEMLRARVRSSKSKWVFPSLKNDSHITTVAKAFRKARKEAGLPSNLVLYCTRHTVATNITAATGNQHLVARQLGHSSTAPTSRYIHQSTTGVAEIMNQINASRKQESATTRDGHTFGHTQSAVQ